MNRQRLLLACLMAILALSLLYAFWAMPRQEKAPPRAVTPQPATVSAKAAPLAKGEKPLKPSTDHLLLELLNREPQEFPGAGRDIFRFGGRAPVAVAEVAPVEVVPLPAPPKPPPTPEEILKGSLKDIIFLGFLDKAGKRTVFLNSGGETYLVKAGERFGRNKELIAKGITAKQLVVGWIDGPETVTVQLLENETLQPTSGGSSTSGRGAPAAATAPGGRPMPTAITPRRLLMPQRATAEVSPPEEEPPPEEPEDDEDDEDNKDDEEDKADEEDEDDKDDEEGN